MPKLTDYRISVYVEQWIEGHGYETIFQDVNVKHTDLDTIKEIYEKKKELKRDE